MTRPAGRERGFPKGAAGPLWHTTLLARCSVLYLLARLTGETGCVAFAPRFSRQENGRGFCERERTKSLSVFGERRQVYKPPSLVPRVETCIKSGYVSVYPRWDEHRPRHPKSKEAGKHPWGLPALMTTKRTRAGRSRLALKAPCTLTLTAPAGFATVQTNHKFALSEQILLNIPDKLVTTSSKLTKHAVNTLFTLVPVILCDVITMNWADLYFNVREGHLI